MSVKNMAKNVGSRRTAFDSVQELEASKPSDESKEQQSLPTELPTKFKTKVSDYAGKQFKKTTVEMPEEILHAWTVFCATNGLKKRDHFLEILAKELNKKSKG